MARGVAAIEGVEAMLGGRAKAGIIRVLARRRVSRVTELVAELQMSKSAITNALDQMEASGAIRRRREGRDTVAEALPAGEELFRALLAFDDEVKHTLTAPGISEDPADEELDELAAYFAAPSDVQVRASRWDPEEEALPVAEHVWKLPQGLPE